MAEINLDPRQEEALQEAQKELEQNPNASVRTDLGDTEVRAFKTRGMRTTIIHNNTTSQNLNPDNIKPS